VKLISATKKNLFVGCKVYKNKTCYYVYKINETTVWAGLAEADEVLSSVKKKLFKFTEKMKNIDAKKLNYVDLMVDEEDAKRTSVAVPGEPTEKKFLKDCCEREINDWKKLLTKKTGAWKNIFMCKLCEKQINPVKVEGDNVMFSADYLMFWYNLITHKYVFFRDLGATKKK
jgi:hypothetical protein